MGPRRVKSAPREGVQDHDRGAEDRRPAGDSRTATRWLGHPLSILVAVLVGAYVVAAVSLNGVVDTEQVRESQELLDRILAMLTRLVDRHANPKR